ncbi:insulinase family protein [candidate division WWE3 bacterium]|nr:insulinase family protein [candidate division WWE3 bacterium]
MNPKNKKETSLPSNFTKIWLREIPEIQKVAHLFEHKKTKAQVLYLESDDTNKTFGISFKTLPSSSNGVAHILEHCILCGSRKYPVKDPFLQMMKTSLSTFLNAMTFPDKTIYPVASDNNKDFENLVDVYLDSVFFPLLRIEDFKTDGWRYDLKPDSKEVTYEGVVYNEMKGAMSSPEDYMVRQTLKHLFPDTIYAHESGGMPDEIINLSYEDLKAFHKKFYHPSNSKTIFYGNLDIYYYLKKLDVYFNEFEFSADFGDITKQTKFPRPVEKVLPIISNPAAKKNGSFTMAAVLDENMPQSDQVGLEVVSYALFDSEAAPMKKFLEEGLAESLVNGGVADFVLQPFLYFGAKGVDERHLDKHLATYKKMIITALKTLSRAQIESGLNSLEFGLRAPSTNDLGIMYMEAILRYWNYGLDPLAGLYFEKTLENLKKQDVKFFTRLFKKHFLENNRHLTIKYIPDSNFLTTQNNVENKNLLDYFAKLNKKEKNALVRSSIKLLTYKEKTNDPKLIEKLPRVLVSDISSGNREYATKNYTLCDTPVFQVTTDSKGVVFLTLAFDISHLVRGSLVKDLGIKETDFYTLLITYFHTVIKLGTKKYNYKEWALLLERELGSLSVSFEILPIFEGFEVYPLTKDVTEKTYAVFSLKVLEDKLPKASEILSELFNNIDFNQPEKIIQLLTEARREIEESLVSSGISYAITKATSGLSFGLELREKVAGIASLETIKSLITNLRLKNYQHYFVDNLLKLHKVFINKANLILNVGLNEKAQLSTISKTIENFLSNIGNQTEVNMKFVGFSSKINSNIYGDFKKLKLDERVPIPADVNFVARAVDISLSGYIPSGVLYIVNNLISLDYLWKEIRVKGGAYGVSGKFDFIRGILLMGTYRDPNIENSFKVYDGVFNYLQNLKLTKRDLDGYVIGAIADFDPYMRAGSLNRALFFRYLQGITPTIREKLGSQILNTSPDDIKKFSSKMMGDNLLINNVTLFGERGSNQKGLDLRRI